MNTPRNLQGRSAGSMTIDRLNDVLDAYGASAEKWPAAERGAILALLNSSAEARALRDGAYALDRVLDRLESPPPSESLFDSVAEMKPAAPQRKPRQTESRLAVYGRPAALAASVLVGVCIGFGAGNYEAEPVAERQTVQTAPAEEIATPETVVAVQGPPAAASIANPNASSGLGIAPLLAGSDAPADDSEGPVPLI